MFIEDKVHLARHSFRSETFDQRTEMPAHRTPKGVPLIHTTLRSINIELLTEFLWNNLQTQSPSLRTNQVIVNRAQIVIDRSDRFDFDLTLRDDFVE